MENTPLPGYRAWQYNAATGELVSCYQGTPWNSVPASAECMQGRSHKAPKWQCTCGYYSFKNEEYVQDLVNGALCAPGRPLVFGRVAIWGHYIEALDGYKSEYAYPQVLYYGGSNPLIRCTREDLRPAANRYGCELLPMPQNLEATLDAKAELYCPVNPRPVFWWQPPIALFAYFALLFCLAEALTAHTGMLRAVFFVCTAINLYSTAVAILSMWAVRYRTLFA